MDLDIRYARSSGAAIAYQVVGDADVDLVWVPDYVSNLVYAWESTRVARFYKQLASFSRLILFDKRSTGLSDHTGGFPTLETRMEDLRAVLDAVGSTNAVVFGSQEGCSMASLFAATYPERTRALVLFQPVVSVPELAGGSEAERARELADLRERWGTREFCDELLAEGAPSLARDEEYRHWFANWLRVSASPAAAYALNRIYFETNLRDVLPAIGVPTLVLYRGDASEPHARDVCAHIPDARMTRLTGDDFFDVWSSAEAADVVERFVSGADEVAEPHRVLATLLFTDLVGSTTHAAALGDHAWRELLTRHHEMVRQEVSRFRGREVDSAGDGVFATFDGPARAIRCADAIRRRIADLGLDVRFGIHTGECELVDDKPAGIAVHTAARISAAADGGEIVVSRTVKDLVAGSGVRFEDRGTHSLKGVPDEWQLYRVAAT
jgi:class 3 adenylate cyclase